MDSTLAAQGFVAIRQLLSNQSILLLEKFHHALYVEGKNILDTKVQFDIANSFGLSKEAFTQSRTLPETQEVTLQEQKKAKL